MLNVRFLAVALVAGLSALLASALLADDIQVSDHDAAALIGGDCPHKLVSHVCSRDDDCPLAVGFTKEDSDDGNLKITGDGKPCGGQRGCTALYTIGAVCVEPLPDGDIQN